MVSCLWLNICWREELTWRQKIKLVMCHVSSLDMKPYTSHMNIMCEMYQNGWTPLITAAIHGRLPIIEHLAERGADLEANAEVSDAIIDMKPQCVTDMHTTHVQQGQSVLHLVSRKVLNFNLAVEIVATLLKYGADLSAVDKV